MDAIATRLHRHARALEQVKRQQAEQSLGPDLYRKMQDAHEARAAASAAQCDGTGLDTVATEDGPEAIACTGCPACKRRRAAFTAALAGSYEDEGPI